MPKTGAVSAAASIKFRCLNRPPNTEVCECPRNGVGRFPELFRRQILTVRPVVGDRPVFFTQALRDFHYLLRVVSPARAAIEVQLVQIERQRRGFCFFLFGHLCRKVLSPARGKHFFQPLTLPDLILLAEQRAALCRGKFCRDIRLAAVDLGLNLQRIIFARHMVFDCLITGDNQAHRRGLYSANRQQRAV